MSIERYLHIAQGDIAKYLVGIGGVKDTMGNIIVRKGQPRKAVNAHLDFVAVWESQRESHRLTSKYSWTPHWSVHPVEKPIEKHIPDSVRYLHADDKVGIAICLELLDTQQDLLAVFTQGEETGLVGSYGIDPKVFDNIAYCLTFDRQRSVDIVTSICGQPLASPTFAARAAHISQRLEAYGLPADPLAFATRRLVPNCLNISCGYYLPHTAQSCYVTKEVLETYTIGQKLLNELPLDEPAWWDFYTICCVCHKVMAEEPLVITTKSGITIGEAHSDCIFNKWKYGGPYGFMENYDTP